MSKVVKADWKEAETVDEVEAASDILVVSTDSSTPVATGASLKEESLVASIGANATVKHEVSNNLIRRMDLIVTDDLAAAKADSGDLVEACQTRHRPLGRHRSSGKDRRRWRASTAAKKNIFPIQRHRRRRPRCRPLCIGTSKKEKT